MKRGNNSSSRGELNFGRRTSDRRGIFTVIEGLDGIGKGLIERTIIEYEQKLGRAIFDTIAFSKAWEDFPDLKDFFGVPKPHFNTIVTAEPTYVGIGDQIRNEIVSSKHDREYSSTVQIQAYSIDRLQQMRRIVIPALQNGLNVIQSRSVASTLTYQTLYARGEKRDVRKVWSEILKQEGNALQLKYAPDLLIIATIDDPQKVIDRIKARTAFEKNDRTRFETFEFQGKLKPLYERPNLRKLFEQHGSTVAYLDAGKSIEKSRTQAVEIYKSFLEKRAIPTKYQSLKQLGIR